LLEGSFQNLGNLPAFAVYYQGNARGDCPPLQRPPEYDFEAYGVTAVRGFGIAKAAAHRHLRKLAEMNKSTKLWVTVGIGTTLFFVGDALVFSDPFYRSQIEKFQTLLAGMFAIFAATIAFLGTVRAANIQTQAGHAQAQANFDLNRRRDAALRQEEMLSIAIAIYSEILLFREGVARLARILANMENRGDDIDAQFLEDHRLAEPTLYPALAAKLGLLPPDLLIIITQFYSNLQHAKRPTENELSDFSRLWHDGCGKAIIQAQDVDRNHSSEV
jgi:hypothetical protein